MINTLFLTGYIKRNYNNWKWIIATLWLINLLFLTLESYNFYYINSLLLIASIIDIKEYRIPNYLPLGILTFRLIILDLRLTNAISSMLIFAALLAFYRLSGGLGMGDVKLLLSLVFLKDIDYTFVFLFILSIVLFITAATISISSKGKVKRIPLAPIICLAYILHGGMI